MAPHQLRRGVPDGAALIIAATKAWVSSTHKKQIDDLQNTYGRVYGRVYHSVCMEAATCSALRS